MTTTAPYLLTRHATAGLGQRARERFNLDYAYQDSGFEMFFAGALDAPQNMPSGACSSEHARPYIATIERP